MEVAVYNIKGKETSAKVSLNDAVFAIEPVDHVLYLDVKQYLANKRQGTHKSKHRGEVSGSTRKLKKQKGTGTARAGSIKSPLFRGGGRMFGPIPRDYSFKLNVKTKRLARRSALSYKVKEQNLIILEDFNFDAPKTKLIVDIAKCFNFADEKVLLVVPDNNKNVLLSARNLQKFDVVTADELNTYQIMNASKLMLLKGSIEKIEKILA